MKRVLLLIAVAWVASACGGDDDGVTYFVGAVSQSDVVIGVSSKQGLAKLYVCGGDATYQDTTRWLEGTLDNDGGSFAANDGWSATVTRVPKATSSPGRSAGSTRMAVRSRAST